MIWLERNNRHNIEYKSVSIDEVWESVSFGFLVGLLVFEGLSFLDLFYSYLFFVWAVLFCFVSLV